jgi:hypothetical protein
VSDLISRKAVIDYLREQHDSLTIEQNNSRSTIHPEALKGMNCTNEAFNHFILGLPTAYDADKVVEQLENEPSCGFGFKGLYTKKAVEIVKGGGRGE